MPEPKHNPNPRLLVDPPSIVRIAIRKMFDRVVLPARVQATRNKVEAKRKKANLPHTVEYFHQFDDPYSHLTAQVIGQLAQRYKIDVKIHYIHATGGVMQPKEQMLQTWARRDAAMVAPHYGLTFPDTAPEQPAKDHQQAALGALASRTVGETLKALPEISTQLWSGTIAQDETHQDNLLDAGSARLKDLGHYSGAMFYYGGEWYWGVDRLLHLENRLRDLGLCHDPALPLICPRPEIDLSGVDASGIELDFYASLNSPYSAIIFDKTVEAAATCGIKFNFKPVLPMLMRGLPVPKSKGMYLLFDTKREAQLLDVPFGPVMLPVGKPVRQIYALLPWAKDHGKDLALMSSAFRLAFSQGAGLHRTKIMRRVIEDAGLPWSEAQTHLNDETWKPMVSGFQDEMDHELGLWGVPCYRLRADDKNDELCVWGQDRLWLVAADIKKRVGGS